MFFFFKFGLAQRDGERGRQDPKLFINQYKKICMSVGVSLAGLVYVYQCANDLQINIFSGKMFYFCFGKNFSFSYMFVCICVRNVSQPVTFAGRLAGWQYCVDVQLCQPNTKNLINCGSNGCHIRCIPTETQTHTEITYSILHPHSMKKKRVFRNSNLNYEKTMMLPVCMDVEIKEFKFSVFFIFLYKIWDTLVWAYYYLAILFSIDFFLSSNFLVCLMYFPSFRHF